jgi:hypothetical protein
LPHVVGDKVEAAYRRGDLFEKRRKLMAAWATYCMTPTEGEKVIPIGRWARSQAVAIAPPRRYRLHSTGRHLNPKLRSRGTSLRQQSGRP